MLRESGRGLGVGRDEAPDEILVRSVGVELELGLEGVAGIVDFGRRGLLDCLGSRENLGVNVRVVDLLGVRATRTPALVDAASRNAVSLDVGRILAGGGDKGVHGCLMCVGREGVVCVS